MEPPPEAAAAPPSTANDNPNKTRDQTIGLLLAMSSTIFIGSSFIIKKQGLRKAGAAGSRAGNLQLGRAAAALVGACTADTSGVQTGVPSSDSTPLPATPATPVPSLRPLPPAPPPPNPAGAGGFGYLRQPLWWIGMFAMIFGEAANFAAYAFAPAILVTPLGALSIIVSAVMAHFILGEKLNVFGVVGCLLCMNGSLTVVLHAPHEKPVESVVQIWAMALKPGFATYALLAILTCAFLIWYVGPRWGNTNILVYLLICSLAGSLSVMSVKALGVALKLTAQGDSQFRYPQTYISALVSEGVI